MAVWLDGALHFNTGRTARKARNLAGNPHCVAPTVVFAFGKEKGFSATRWRF